ncbi:MAG: S9 family peptidase [Candidatus Saccharicenans sp.]|uniref:S9 family peptidase n=1 Tax=Candidatus Saccharicenans sp. TaxID=2819258 RepID=UPI00404A5749
MRCRIHGWKLLSALLVFLFLAWPFGEIQAEETRTYRLLTTETFFDFESLSNPSISPDGRRVVFTRSWIDKINDQTRSNIWIIETNGSRLRQLTSGNWKDTYPVWSPDGQKLAFISDREGSEQLYVLFMDTKEVARLTNLERAPQNPVWSPDGKKIAFTQLVADDRPILPVKLPPRPANAKWAAPAIVIDRLSWRLDGRGPLPRGQTQVFVVDAVVGGTPIMVTSGDYSHNEPAWSADGQKIYVSAIRKPEPEYAFGDTEIYEINLKTREIKALTERHGPDRNPEPSPNGLWVAYTGYDERNYTSHLSNLYLMDSTGQKKKLLAGNLPSSPTGLTWAADSSGIYYRMEERGEANLYFVSLSGQIKKITPSGYYLSSFSLSRNQQVAAVVSNFYRPGFLVVFNLKQPGQWRELLDVNADVLEGVKLGTVEELWYKSPDGLDIQGWLIKPAEFEPGKKYPLLLWIHGGPWSIYSVAFNWAWQNFAAMGYAVLYTNPRGSTGYGQDFVNGIQYSYPGRDYDDLMAGVDAALSCGFIDEDNLFVCGGSGGGVLTAWIVGHTNRFRAAVSMRPVINWHSFVGTTDMPTWYRQFQKYPWEDPLEYAARSPLTYVANVITPTMIMTGEADLRTPIGQSEEFYRALKMLKKETLLVRMPEEYHGWRRPSQ